MLSDIAFFKFPKLFIEEHRNDAGRLEYYIVEKTAIFDLKKYIEHTLLGERTSDERDRFFVSGFKDHTYCYPAYEEAERIAEKYMDYKKKLDERTKEEDKAKKLLKFGLIKKTRIK